ncbi:DUF668 family protein [Melia azedarach]|uniref:DUF668 family protein n=1 Tax=Melia azedarach TaxID=155640 RepID=A0ACC1WTB2_MELAZ|nr:DUF668 family protein [Melia azedarach]
MGGVCSRGTTKQSRKVGENNLKFSGKLKSVKGSNQKQHSNAKVDDLGKNKQKMSREEPALSFSRELSSNPDKKGSTKVSQKRSFLGRGGITGLAMTVDVLDALGSSMSNLNANGGFISTTASRGNKISILAFEVANTIAKGANLFQSLSDENIQFLKKEILNSEAVQKLVSTDMKELLRIAAADKREELDVFLHEVIRFGNRCKDPQWHNLDRYFSNLNLEYLNHKQLREEAEMRMQELTTLAQHTSELYHELNAMDRFDQDYRRKLEELDSLNLPRKGESLMILQSELKQQKKIVRSLTKKSLWSKNLEEIIEKLVDIASYMHQAILEAFGNDGRTMVNEEPSKTPQSLGLAGLALHYANVINQIDNIASRPTSLPPSMRDTLYNGLPPNVKTALRSRLQTLMVKEELSAFQIKAEMEKTLQWLVPVATNTTKAHQGFGWVGEWANTGHEFGKSTTKNNSPTRLQTLYHADKQKTERYILELVIWLNSLISVLRNRDHGSQPLPSRSPNNKGVVLHSKMQHILSLNNDENHWIQLSPEDRNLLDKVSARRLIPGISKSQEFYVAKKERRVWALSRSTGNSPNRERGMRHSLEYAQANILDVMDGLDSRF